MGKRKLTPSDHARLRRMEANASTLRELAKRGLADLERRYGNPVRPPGLSDGEWVGRLGEIERTERQQ
jgi:hypothetical protein